MIKPCKFFTDQHNHYFWSSNTTPLIRRGRILMDKKGKIFILFWPLPPYCRQFFSTIRRQIWQIFDPSPPKTCRRLKWMVPKGSFTNYIYKIGRWSLSTSLYTTYYLVFVTFVPTSEQFLHTACSCSAKRRTSHKDLPVSSILPKNEQKIKFIPMVP